MTAADRTVLALESRLDRAVQCAEHALDAPAGAWGRLVRRLGDLDRVAGDAAAAIVHAPHADHRELIEALRPAGAAIATLRAALHPDAHGMRWRCDSIAERLSKLTQWSASRSAA